MAPERLRCVSVHSVKGGVGKSTLSYAIARALARRGPTLLVDMDLTGTSLADVLPLEAPSWDGPMELWREPSGPAIPWEQSQERLRERAGASENGPVGVPLLNDFLLWRGGRADERDVHPLAVAWRDPATPDLRVIPSSALPRDLDAILPIIYDELHAGWLESRLEWLLHHILERTPVRSVVFDTPPTIPGLSRALLSMAIRLPQQIDLAEEGGTPPALKAHEIRWDPLLVVSPDHQDLRAAERWLVGRDEAEVARVRVVLNLTERMTRRELVFRLRGALAQRRETPPAQRGDELVFDAETNYYGTILEEGRSKTHLAVVQRDARLNTFRPAADRDDVLEPDVSDVLRMIDV